MTTQGGNGTEITDGGGTKRSPTVLSASRRVWLLSACMLAATVCLWAAEVRHLPKLDGPFTIPWIALAALFYVTEIFVVHFQIRSNAHSFSLSELPLVLGLFFVSPSLFVLAQLIGAAAALGLHRRQSVLKLVFNISHFCFEAALATMVFHLIVGTANPISTRGIVGAIAASALATCFSVLVIFLAISLSEGRPQADKLPSVIGFGLIVTGANTCLALIAVLILWRDPAQSWLMLVPAATLIFAYRAYVGQRHKHESLDFLYQSARTLHESSEIEAAVLAMLAQARDVFRAEMAELLIMPPKGEQTVLRTTLGPGERTDVMVPCDPAESHILSKLRGRGAPSLLWTEGEADASPVGEYLSRRMRDAMVARLHGESGTVGFLIVANRLGEVSTFDTADLMLFETLASHVGVALENGRLEKSLAQVTVLKEELRHQAFHDTLTGLANRSLFTDRVHQALTTIEQEGTSVAVVFVDLDDFKTVNDSLGHAAGDELLVSVAQRLGNAIRPSDTAARLGGDEFGLLIPYVSDDTVAIEIVERMMGVFESPVLVQGRALPVHASLGVAFGRSADANADELIRNADLAMYRAKSRGKGRYELFDPSLHEAAVARMELKGRLQRAVEGPEGLFLEYQPIVALDTGNVVAVEALVRWEHPQLATLGPEHFVPLAEETGLILPLGRWVLEEACRQMARCRELTEDNPIAVSVNISPRQIQDPGMIAELGALIAESGADPTTLVLEVTETVLMQDAEAAKSKLRALKDLGVQLAIDDFGKGYSSLSYLKSFPIDIVKIPMEFVHGIGTNPEDGAVAEAIVQLAAALHLKVVGEGIETPSQWEILNEMGCHFGQGFFFCRPVDVDGLFALVTHPDRRLGRSVMDLTRPTPESTRRRVSPKFVPTSG